MKKIVLIGFCIFILASFGFAECCEDCGYETIARHYSDSSCTQLWSEYTVCHNNQLASYPGVCSFGWPADSLGGSDTWNRHYYTGNRCNLGDCPGSLPSFEDYCYDPLTSEPEPLSSTLDSSRITHYWPFNGNANDLHGGKTGTLRNNPTFTEGKFGNALTLNGIDQYVTLSPNFANTQSVTVGGWIYYNESQEGRVSCILTDMDDVSGNDFEFCITHNGLRLRAHKSGALLNDNIVLNGIDFRNSWNHIVWVMESTQSRVFVNGTQVALIEKSGSNVGFHYTPQIGRRYDGGGTRGGAWEFNYFKGKIDELFYTTEILTDCEIKQLALGPTACLPVCEVPEQESFIEVTLGNDGTGYLIQWDALHMTYTIPSQGNISIELAFSNGESRSYYLNDQTSLHHYLEPINTDAHNVTLLVGLKGDAEIYNISFDKTTIEEVENTFSLCCSQDSVGVQFNNSGITEKFVCSVIPDGVCPEDFEDADGNRISCAAFRDPDCGYDSRFYRSNLFQRLMQLTFEERSYIISTNNNESARLTVIDEENQIGIGTGTYTYDFRILSEVSSEHSVSEIVFSYAQTPPTIIFDNTEVLECSSTPSPTCYIWYDGSYTLELHHTLSDHSLRVIFTYRHISWILILLIAILGLLPVLLVLHGKKMLHYIENTMAKRLSDDIERLGIHVRKLKKSGKTKEHIHSTMAEAGWKKHLVELALHQLDAGKGSDKKIIEYIKTCKGHGVKNSEIYVALLSAGWEREKIDEVFKKL